MKEKTTKVCPICGSPKLYYEVGGKIGFVYHCKNCGYIGSFIVEANEEMVQALKNLFLCGAPPHDPASPVRAYRKALTKEKNKSKTNGDKING